MDNDEWFEDLNDEMMCEVAYGILGRAQDIHSNPDNEHEDTALELRSLASKMIKEYE